jgi:peptidyl-Lys metalloendopeptidase
MQALVRWTAIAAALTLAATAHAAQNGALAVQMSLANPVVNGDVDVAVDLTVTNTANHPVLVAKWQLPTGELTGPLFRIVRDDGSTAPYVGRMVKRAAPRAADLITLLPGESRTVHVELTGAYDLSRNGHYTIEYAGLGQHPAAAELVGANATHLWLSGRSGIDAATFAVTPEARTQSGSISYTGNCSSSQKSSLSSAVGAARNYANGAVTYLNGTPGATQRFQKWFGTYSSSHWSTARTHFVNEQNAFNNAALVMDCSCTDSGTYAYVYPTQPYKIYLCGAFWSAPMTGTDSKGGTLIHEMSHFNVIAGTNDYVYGQTAAANLAKTSPTKALDNADNHEYFAENNPYLP